MWVNGKKIVGTMPNIEASTTDLKPGGTYQIPEGHHSGNGSVTVKSLAYYTPANATASDILTTKNAWVNGVKVEGTMANNGAVSSTLAAGASYTVPKGYHNGSGVIKAQDLASQTSANATADDILSPKTAWVNGKKITGKMLNQGSRSFRDLAAGSNIKIPEGYYSGYGYITTLDLATQTQSDATANNILITKTAWVNGVKVTGSMPNNGSWTQENVNAGSSVTIPKGYHNGSGRITTKSLRDQTQSNAVPYNLLIAKTAWVNGSKITGTMPDNTGWSSKEMVAGSSATIPAGFHDGTGVITAKSLTSQTQATAGAADILSPKTAWVNGSKLLVLFLLILHLS